MAELHCLYCEKPLGLMARLSGGEFCGREHRDLYQQEHTRLALARLIQAQPAPARTPREPDAGKTPDMAGFQLSPPAVAPGFTSAMTGEPPYGLQCGVSLGAAPQGIRLISPGAFLRRDVQPGSVPGPQWRLEVVPFPEPEARLGYLEECLRRSGRAGTHAA